ncbi:hypothetical protein BC332_33633 [Capsicum chinense]|nr:hypothetical protein BC332_33633 [Capsicum chinense]
MVLQNKSDGCESRFIQEIVKVVVRNLNRAVLSVALHPIGIDSRVDIMAIYDRHNGLVSLQNEIEEMLDHVRRIKSGGDLDSFKIDQIERHEMDLRLLRTFVKLESHLLEVIDGNTSLSYNSELNGSDRSKYMDFLRENLNDLLKRHRESDRSYLETNQFTKQLEIVQKKIKFFRYLYAIEINGYVNHEKLECLQT